jgi:aspartate aminotransferase
MPTIPTFIGIASPRVRVGQARPLTLEAGGATAWVSARDDLVMPASPHLTVGPPPSPTLAADQRMRERIAAGRPVIHLAFGEAGLPVPDSVREVLARASVQNAYGAVVGSAAARAAAAGYYARRRVPTDPDQIVFAPGSKPLLWALIETIGGDVILPRPSWVSYGAQAQIAGRRVWPVEIGAPAGGVPDPAALRETLVRARRASARPGLLVLTLPDNPTGTFASGSVIAELVEIAQSHGLAIICDEIYRDLAHHPEALVSPAELAPEQVFITNGLSKSMALGGWRIGFARLPDGPLGRDARVALGGLASEIWSSLAAPMQAVAAHVLDEPADVTEHVARGRWLHARTTLAAHEIVTGAGARCRTPTAAFYLYPDLEPLRVPLAAAGIDGGDALAEWLLEDHEIGVLSGAAFGDDPRALRFRMATSLLYGADDEQRRVTLHSEDPASLPWIAQPLAKLGAALAVAASNVR